jgi:hypothetical protein
MSTLKRTPEEIIARLEKIKEDDFFGFQSEDLIIALPWPDIKPFLKEEFIPDYEAGIKIWNQYDDPIKELKDYMSFALGKAKDHRGLSAGRSIDHMTSWIWLAGEDELLEKVETAPYAQYGAPKLKLICEHFEIPLPQEEWFVNMSQGKRCHPDCEEGCG